MESSSPHCSRMSLISLPCRHTQPGSLQQRGLPVDCFMEVRKTPPSSAPGLVKGAYKSFRNDSTPPGCKQHVGAQRLIYQEFGQRQHAEGFALKFDLPFYKWVRLSWSQGCGCVIQQTPHHLVRGKASVTQNEEAIVDLHDLREMACHSNFSTTASAPGSVRVLAHGQPLPQLHGLKWHSRGSSAKSQKGHPRWHLKSGKGLLPFCMTCPNREMSPGTRSL